MAYNKTTNKFGFILPGEAQRTKYTHIKTRYRGRFLGFGDSTADGNELTLDMQKFGIPSGDFEDKSISQPNGDIYYPGKWSWKELTITVFNTYDNAAYKAVCNQLQKQRDFAEQTTGTVPENYKFTAFLEHTDGHQNAIATWVMEGCFIKSPTFGGDFENGNYDAMTIDLALKFDNATLYDFDGTLLTGKLLDSTLMSKVLATN